MRITKLETLCLSRMHEPERQWLTARYRTVKADCAIVIIHTDEGLTGIGEASAYGWPRKIRKWVQRLSPMLVGKDPMDMSIAPHPNGRTDGRPHDAAVGGIDCALWDLRGKITGKQTAKLLNPNALDKVRLYASSGCRYDWRERPEQLIEEALEYVDQGLTAMKFRLGTEWAWDGVTVDRFLGLVRELTQEVDGRMELMVDGNCRLNEEQALQVAIELDRLGFAWFEEPISKPNLEGYVRLNKAVEMPITGGESWNTLEQFMPFLEAGAYGIAQPDAAVCGITEAMRIAEAAWSFGIDTAPHSWHNGLMATEHAHYVAALPNPRVLELCMIQGPLQWAILDTPPTIEDGYLILPDKPGLGVEIAEDLEARFPYVEGHYGLQVQRYIEYQSS